MCRVLIKQYIFEKKKWNQRRLHNCQHQRCVHDFPTHWSKFELYGIFSKQQYVSGVHRVTCYQQSTQTIIKWQSRISCNRSFCQTRNIDKGQTSGLNKYRRLLTRSCFVVFVAYVNIKNTTNAMHQNYRIILWCEKSPCKINNVFKKIVRAWFWTMKLYKRVNNTIITSVLHHNYVMFRFNTVKPK